MALEDLISVPEFAPVEDLFLGLLRPLEGLVPGLKVRTAIESGATFTAPYVFIQRTNAAFAGAAYGGDERFTQRCVVSVHVFCREPDGEEKASRLSEIVRRVLLSAWLKGQVVPQSGSMRELVLLAPPHRATDWSSGTAGDYLADLPVGLVRYETEYGVVLRPTFDAGDPLALFA